MAKFNINLPYLNEKEAAATPLTNQELTLDYVTGVITAANKQGLEGQKRRIFSRIQRKLEEAIETKAESIDIEVAELDLLEKSFEGAALPAQISKFICILEDEVDRIRKELK